MRQTIIFIFLIIIVTSCQRNNNLNTDSPINVIAEKVRTFDSTYTHDNITRQSFYIKLLVKNISDKPMAYWTMTCAWDDNWLTNKDNYKIVSTNSCDANFPITRHLNPYESFTYNVVVCCDKNEALHPNENKLKLGFIYIDTVVCKDINDFEKFIGDSSKQRIIWSNSLDLE